MVHYTVAPANPSSISGDGYRMTAEQFREWIKSVDRDGDGMISRLELRDALRVLGLSCTRWKAWHAMAYADLNRNKHIDGDCEVEELIKYAAKHWGIAGA